MQSGQLGAAVGPAYAAARAGAQAGPGRRRARLGQLIHVAQHVLWGGSRKRKADEGTSPMACNSAGPQDNLASPAAIQPMMHEPNLGPSDSAAPQDSPAPDEPMLCPRLPTAQQLTKPGAPSLVSNESTAPQNSPTAAESALSPKLSAARQLVQSDVQMLFQAITAAVGHGPAAGCGQPAAPGLAALYDALMAAAAGAATPVQAQQAADAAHNAETFVRLLVLFEPRALTVLLQLPGAAVDVAAALLLACQDVIASPGTSLLHHFQQHVSSRKVAKTPATAAAAVQEPQEAQQPAAPTQKRARLSAGSTGALASSTSSSNTNSNSTTCSRHPRLSPDDALDLLLYAPDGKETRKYWNKHLKRPAGIDDNQSNVNPRKLDFLRGVHYLPAACDDILTVLVGKRTEPISPQAAADRVQKLRACAAKYA